MPLRLTEDEPVLLSDPPKVAELPTYGTRSSTGEAELADPRTADSQRALWGGALICAIRLR